jgi:hypothetical protein
MSMKFFTLSAVCMLIFCMLLALSGTTDFPGGHPEIASRSGLVSPPPVSSQLEKGEARASVHSPPARPEPQGNTESGMGTTGSVARHGHLLLLGAVFIVGWILLSFRLLSRSEG